ncbi:hypothetical protein NMY22_g8406 [Coprinellus aureogranulatus]|nr:hypothetical protein NMY22_g8406 [Coprinellus aureogranulatus]
MAKSFSSTNGHTVAGTAPIWVRPFRDEDAGQVRELFVRGICCGADSTREVAMRSMFTETVALPSYPLFSLGLGLSTFAQSNLLRLAGGLLSAASVAWVAFLRWNASQDVRRYCSHSLNDDLADIGRHYRVTRRDHGVEDDDGGASYFWVAETEEEGTKVIVGCVGLDSLTQSGKTFTELRRMSIHGAYRRRGIASLLLNTLISYAKERGAKKVVLSTTSWQASARKMYERFGWVDVRQEAFTWLIRRGKIHFLELDL